MSQPFSREMLLDLLYGDSDDLKIIERKIVDRKRWSLQYQLIFKDLLNNKHYLTHYWEGATEIQEQSPFEGEPDMIECHEVEKVKVERTEWVKTGE